jgi:ABC-2 type transport system permease protein
MNPRTHLFWSIRRELWENRSVWMAPLAVGLLIVLAFAVVTDWAEALRLTLPKDARAQLRLMYMPYGLAASVILFTGWLVALFYALDALNGERRDRSILFWKSMPVSDLTTVLAKAALPLLVVPLFATAIALATQLAMLVAGSVVLAAKGLDASIAWTRVPWFATTAGMLYGTAVHTLWFAPIYAYLLLVSAAVRRATFLWAFLPLFAVVAVEWLAFRTMHFASLLKDRVVGGMIAFKPEAMSQPIMDLAQLDPERFFASPGLWLGLLFATACIAGAIRLRRYREPI